MAHKSTIFKKTCRIITSLIGIAVSIFLIFSYSNKYWLEFFGYRNLVISTFFLLFSLGTFITAILPLVVSKKYFKTLEYYFSLLFAIDFFLVIFILYFSSFKTKEEVYYWISEYNSTHQNQQILSDFFADYPPNRIDSYVRGHTIVVHDVVLLSILIWLIFFILYTFYAHRIMKYLLGKKSLPGKEVDLGNSNSEFMHDIETEYEYEYSYEDTNSKPTNKNDRMKINHVKSADKILHLVNIDDKVPSQSPISPKSDISDSKSIDDNKDNDDAKENDTTTNDKSRSPSSLNSSLTQPTPKESDKDTKPPKKKRRKRSQGKSQSQSQDNDGRKGKFNDDLSEEVIVSISPINNQIPQPKKKKFDFPKYNWGSNAHFGLSSDSAPRKKYPALKYKWNKPINMHLSSDSYSSGLLDDGNLYSSFILYDSDDSITFGFDYSDSWS